MCSDRKCPFDFYFKPAAPQPHNPTHPQTHKHKTMAWRNARSRSESADNLSGGTYCQTIKQELNILRIQSSNSSAHSAGPPSKISPNDYRASNLQIVQTCYGFLLAPKSINIYLFLKPPQSIENPTRWFQSDQFRLISYAH